MANIETIDSVDSLEVTLQVAERLRGIREVKLPGFKPKNDSERRFTMNVSDKNVIMPFSYVTRIRFHVWHDLIYRHKLSREEAYNAVGVKVPVIEKLSILIK